MLGILKSAIDAILAPVARYQIVPGDIGLLQLWKPLPPSIKSRRDLPYGLERWEFESNFEYAPYQIRYREDGRRYFNLVWGCSTLEEAKEWIKADKAERAAALAAAKAHKRSIKANTFYIR